MSASESDTDPTNTKYESSADEKPRSSSQRLTSNPPTPRKRRRSRSLSFSPDTLRAAKRHLDGQYNDAYRTLYNQDVTSAAARFNLTDPFFSSSHPLEGQIGASRWSSKEKSMFYAALERLGRDDVPGIAAAIGTKSIPETRELLIILRDASVKHREARLTIRDIPAAVEVSPECNGRLELAGDALAWYQERFEAKQERERFGDYWLLTPEIADQIEDALRPSRRPSVSSTPGLEAESAPLPANDDSTITPILQEIPESNLLQVSTLLNLSSTFFMNSSHDLPSPSPHWSALVSPLATRPSIYRTALIDFHTLVVSLTRRITQACITQATSRLRSQGWRTKKGVKPFVKPRDVFTAIDMLGLKRNGRERWRGVARRCGLRVFDGKGKSRREVDWNEVERILALPEDFASVEDMDLDADGPGTDVEDFKARAVRSGTPLPGERINDSGSEQEEDIDKEYEDESSGVDDSIAPGSPASTKASRASQEFKLSTLEDFDHEASLNEETRLWNIIDASSSINRAKRSPKRGEEVEELELKESNKIASNKDDWRDWTEYRSAWEDLRTSAPAAKFRANQKTKDSSYLPSREHGDTNYETQTSCPSSADERRGDRRKKRKTNSEHEIPIRGARAYAAMQEDRISEDRDADVVDSSDDSKLPTQSIEI